MRSFFLLFGVVLAGFFLGCKSDHSQSSIRSQTSTIQQLKARKDSIDSVLSKGRKSLLIFAKVPGRTTLVPIENDKWPDKIEYTYNVLKGVSGKINFIAEIPYSESGDWDIEHLTYFDESGKTFAFVDKQSIFTDYKGGIVRAIDTRYFNKRFHQIKKTEELLDKDFKPVVVEKANFNFREDYFTICKSVNECLKGYGILL